MTQQSWGGLKVETEELIKIFHQVASTHIVALTCHESNDTIEGMEDEIIPDFRPNTTRVPEHILRVWRTMAFTWQNEEDCSWEERRRKEVVRYIAHLGANSYYWTKLQTDPSIKIPAIVVNPTYDKIMSIVRVSRRAMCYKHLHKFKEEHNYGK